MCSTFRMPTPRGTMDEVSSYVTFRVTVAQLSDLCRDVHVVSPFCAEGPTYELASASSEVSCSL
jgi:hypothetical protein